MDQLALLFVVLLCTIIVVPLARRIGLPFPVLLTMLGIVLALIPFVPNVEINPELILPLALPPLLYAAVQRTSWRQFAVNVRPILLLAVALVLVTTVVVAVVANSIVPGLPLGAAVVLGTIVAPPDPVAATAVAGNLGLPRRLVSILEGEGLFNDVTAIVIYGVAVNAAVTGTFSVPAAVGEFFLSAVIAVVLGLAIGWLARALMKLVQEATLQIALTLLVPFVAYALSDALHGSGVLAVLICAMYLSQYANDPDDVTGRLSRRAVWEVIELLVTGAAFTLIGLELHNVVGGVETTWTELIWPALAVAGVVVLVRLCWLLPLSWVSNRLHHSSDEDEEVPIGWRETLVMWWSGMRGVATIALALAIPLSTDAGKDFPGRPQVLFVAFVVVLVTLVLQGLTLPTLVRRLGVVSEGHEEAQTERELALRASRSALNRLKQIESEEDVPDELAERLRTRHSELLARLSPEAYEEEQRAAVQERGQRMQMIRRIEAEMMSAARAEVLGARSEPGAAPELADRVLRRLDLRSVAPAKGRKPKNS